MNGSWAPTLCSGDKELEELPVCSVVKGDGPEPERLEYRESWGRPGSVAYSEGTSQL